jgi:hypothetical protein
MARCRPAVRVRIKVPHDADREVFEERKAEDVREVMGGRTVTGVQRVVYIKKEKAVMSGRDIH